MSNFLPTVISSIHPHPCGNYFCGGDQPSLNIIHLGIVFWFLSPAKSNNQCHLNRDIILCTIFYRGYRAFVKKKCTGILYCDSVMKLSCIILLQLIIYISFVIYTNFHCLWKSGRCETFSFFIWTLFLYFFEFLFSIFIIAFRSASLHLHSLQLVCWVSCPFSISSFYSETRFSPESRSSLGFEQVLLDLSYPGTSDLKRFSPECAAVDQWRLCVIYDIFDRLVFWWLAWGESRLVGSWELQD